MEESECEALYVQPVPSEHVEEYLEAVWLIEEKGERPAKISTISSRLNVAPPSVVQMLRRLEKDGYIVYKAREGVSLTKTGSMIGRRMVRNGRLVEKLMRDSFSIDVDQKVACGIEHHMTEEFADALCTLLNHPQLCPHGNPIPKGRCCRAERRG